MTVVPGERCPPSSMMWNAPMLTRARNSSTARSTNSCVAIPATVAVYAAPLENTTVATPVCMSLTHWPTCALVMMNLSFHTHPVPHPSTYTVRDNRNCRDAASDLTLPAQATAATDARATNTSLGMSTILNLPKTEHNVHILAAHAVAKRGGLTYVPPTERLGLWTATDCRATWRRSRSTVMRRPAGASSSR